MIDTNMLTQNNWVTAYNHTFQITEIEIDHVCGKKGDGHAYFKDLEPVKLTRDILSKCGFKKKHYDSLTWQELEVPQTLNLRVEISTGDKNGILEVLIEIGELEIRTSELHVLQNWYKILFNQELKVKL